MNTSPLTDPAGASRASVNARAASRQCTLGRHWSPPKIAIFLSTTARTVSVLTTRSKRMRGDRPNTVARRSTTGSTSPRRSNRMFSLSTRVRAYNDTGSRRERSVSMPSLFAPYTLQLDANTRRRTP